MGPITTVFLLWHGDDLQPDTPESKFLGIYSTQNKAIERIERCRHLPGFAEHPDDFLVVPHEIDRDDWPEGYVEV